MAKKPTEQQPVSLRGLAEAFDELQAEQQALRAIVSAVLMVQRMDPHTGEERLSALRELAAAALPLPEKKADWTEGDHRMLALFTEIFDSVNSAANAMNGVRNS